MLPYTTFPDKQVISIQTVPMKDDYLNLKQQKSLAVGNLESESESSGTSLVPPPLSFSASPIQRDSNQSSSSGNHSSSLQTVKKAVHLKNMPGGGFVFLGQNPIAQFMYGPSLTEKDFIRIHVSHSESDIKLFIESSGLDIQFDLASIQFKGVRVQVGGFSSSPPSSPRSSRKKEKMPWWCFLPFGGLFWKPLRQDSMKVLTKDLPEASKKTWDRGSAQLEQLLPVIIGGIVIPVVCGIQIALDVTNVWNAIDNKVDALKALAKAESNAEKWNILIDYAGAAGIELAIKGLGKKLKIAEKSLAPYTGDIITWAKANRTYLMQKLLLLWIKDLGKIALKKYMRGEVPQDMQEVITGLLASGKDKVIKLLLTEALGSKVRGIDLSEDTIAKLRDTLINMWFSSSKDEEKSKNPKN